MRAIKTAFFQMLLFLRKDMMLFAACCSPVLIGIIFKFGIPAAEEILNRYIDFPLIRYYEIFDVLFALLTPLMFCFTASMIILEELDDNIAKYLLITPLNKMGYLAARMFIPCGVAFIVSAVLLPVFSLEQMSFGKILYFSACGVLQGCTIALLVITFSTNKLEGMGITKLSSLLILGLLVPYFPPYKMRYEMPTVSICFIWSLAFSSSGRMTVLSKRGLSIRRVERKRLMASSATISQSISTFL